MLQPSSLRICFGSPSPRNTIGSTSCRHFFIQSDVKPKPIVIRSYTSATCIQHEFWLVQWIVCVLKHINNEFTKLRRRLKNNFIFYLRISRYSKIIYFVSRCQNYVETGDQTRLKIWNINFKNYPLWFTFSTQRRTWSFHVVVLQRTAKKCTKNYNARAQPLFWSSNLLFGDILVAAAVVVFLGPVHTNPFPNENGAVLLRFQKDLRPHSLSSYRFAGPHYNADQERSHMVASVRHFGYSWSSLAPSWVYFDDVTVFR